MRHHRFLLGVLAAALVLPVTASATLFRPAAFPVTPADGGRYPHGTWLTGPCDPEDSLPAPQDAPQTRESTHSDFFLLPELRAPIAGVRPTSREDTPQGSGNRGMSDGPCTAFHGGAAGEGGFAGGGPELPAIGRSAVAHKVGRWRLVTEDLSRRYECAGNGICEYWVNLDDDSVLARHTANFEIYDPCSFRIASVTNKRLVRVGTDAAIEGETVEQGNRVLIREEGSITLVGGDGVSVTLGPGEHVIERRPGFCEFKKFEPRGAVQGLVPIEARDGKVTESFLDKIGRQWREIGAAIRGNPNVTYDGLGSGIGPGQRAMDPPTSQRVTFTVKRSKQRRQTVGCALAGRLRIVSTRPKRTLIVPQGRCALTRDGRAPKLR